MSLSTEFKTIYDTLNAFSAQLGRASVDPKFQRTIEVILGAQPIYNPAEIERVAQAKYAPLISKLKLVTDILESNQVTNVAAVDLATNVAIGETIENYRSAILTLKGKTGVKGALNEFISEAEASLSTINLVDSMQTNATGDRIEPNNIEFEPANKDQQYAIDVTRAIRDIRYMYNTFFSGDNKKYFHNILRDMTNGLKAKMFAKGLVENGEESTRALLEKDIRGGLKLRGV